MGKYQKTKLDEEYLAVLKECYDKLLAINQKAVELKEDDVKFSSCHLVEVIDSTIRLREAQE